MAEIVNTYAAPILHYLSFVDQEGPLARAVAQWKIDQPLTVKQYLDDSLLRADLAGREADDSLNELIALIERFPMGHGQLGNDRVSTSCSAMATVSEPHISRSSTATPKSARSC